MQSATLICSLMYMTYRVTASGSPVAAARGAPDAPGASRAGGGSLALRRAAAAAAGDARLREEAWRAASEAADLDLDEARPRRARTGAAGNPDGVGDRPG